MWIIRLYKKNMIEQPDYITEVTGISHEKLQPMPQKISIYVYHAFYPKPKIDLEYATISKETQQNYRLKTGLWWHNP